MSKKVAIIGAGLTGLTCAYELLKKGREVIVYEKNEKVGGLAGSFELEGQSLEKFYHHIFESDSDLINLFEQLGIEKELLWFDSSISTVFDGIVYPFTSPIHLLKFRPLPLFDRFRAGLVVLFLQKYKKWGKFKNISAYEWMKKYGGKKVTEIIWEPLLKGKFRKHYNDISMAWLWARIYVRANSRKEGLSKESLGYFRGGFQNFIDTLVDAINSKGGKIENNITVSGIDKDDKGKVLIQIDKEKPLKFDELVITTPSPVVESLFSKRLLGLQEVREYISKIKNIKYLGVICLVFTSSQNISDYYWHNVNEQDSPFLVFIQHTNLIDKKNYENKHVYYICKYIDINDPFYNSDEKSISSEWFEYLGKIFNNFDAGQVSNQFLFKSKYAQHIVDKKYYNIVPENKEITKHIYLTNFSLIYPEDRGMNYAVREGVKMAEKI
jgi:protoporphyrinogen oxidase